MKKKINTTRKRNMPLAQLTSTPLHFTGKEDHRITLNEASELTRTYRKLNPNQKIAEFFGKQAILDLLNQPGCVGIRIYYGNDHSTHEKHLVIVGAEANKNDIINGFIMERALCCPTQCGVPNVLNT